MRRYLESVINHIAFNEVMEEIVHKTLELQEQGGRFTQAFGYDVEQYCEDLIKEHPKQGLLERSMIILEEIGLFIMMILVFQAIFTWRSPNEGAMIDGIYMYSQLNDLKEMSLYGLAGVIGATIGSKTVYKSTSYKFISCLVVVGILVAISDVFVRTGVNGTIVKIHMPAVLGVSIAVVLFAYYVRPFVARRALKN